MSNLPETTEVALRRIGGALIVTLNRPENRNALGGAMTADLDAALDYAAKDNGIRALILRGAGQTFCAGGNVGGFKERLAQSQAEGTGNPIARTNRVFGDFLIRATNFPKPLVVLAHGAAMGGGFGLCCIGDVVIATRDTKFALSEVTLGVIPAQIAAFVVARIGLNQSRRLGLTGERIDGIEAQRIGLVTFVADDMAGAEAKLAEVLNNIGRCGPLSVRLTKKLLLDCASAPAAELPAVLDRASLGFAEALQSEGGEGVAAFSQKRKASWVEAFDPADLKQ